MGIEQSAVNAAQKIVTAAASAIPGVGSVVSTISSIISSIVPPRGEFQKFARTMVPPAQAEASKLNMLVFCHWFSGDIIAVDKQGQFSVIGGDGGMENRIVNGVVTYVPYVPWAQYDTKNYLRDMTAVFDYWNTVVPFNFATMLSTDTNKSSLVSNAATQHVFKVYDGKENTARTIGEIGGVTITPGVTNNVPKGDLVNTAGQLGSTTSGQTILTTAEAAKAANESNMKKIALIGGAALAGIWMLKR